MSKLKVLLLSCIQLILSSADAQVASSNFAVSKLQQDYEIFTRALKEAHPGLYRYTPKAEMDSLFEKTKNEIRDTMTELGFYKLLMPIIVKIRCGHTKWFRNEKTDDRYAFYDDHLFPFKLYFFNDKAYVVGDYADNNDVVLKSEVLSINGKTIPQIREQISRYLPTDGYVQSSLNEELNQFFNGYFATFVDHQPAYTVTLRTGKRTVTRWVHGVALAAIQSKEQKSRHSVQLPLRFSYPQRSTALLTVERFYIPKEEQDFYAFIDSVFLDLKNKSVENLIIDLRNNEGGEESFGGYLYSYLSRSEFQYYRKITVAQKERVTFLNYAWMPPPYEEERKKFVEKDGEVLWTGQPYLAPKPAQPNSFKGKVFILINGLSFSVTSEFASFVHHNKRATFIGEESGGAYYGNNSGVFTVVTLPNTKLGLGIPLLGFYSNVSGYPYKDRGIIPHHEVKRTVDDMVRGRDAVLDFTLGFIHSTELKYGKKRNAIP